MKYMFLLHRAADEDLPAPGTPEAAAMLTEWGAATGAMTAAGVLIDCAPLGPGSTATTVQVRDDETLLTDGPLPSSKNRSAATPWWNAPTSGRGR